ncbi:MAG: YceI family protein [Gemmatimonadales bacterium]
MSGLLRRQSSRFARTAVGLVWAIVAMPVTAVAQRVVADGTIREGALSFDGHASLGDFTGTTTTVGGELSGGELEAVRGWVEAPVQTLTTDNARRDRDLNKSMESDKYPSLRFDLDGVTPGTDWGDSVEVSLDGRFLIHGVTREVTLPATVTFGPDGVHLRSDFPLNLKDYQIGGLTKLLGVLKMYPDIRVHVSLVFDFWTP